jgi:L-ascorbate metabolism protein UlaG (beta-lactamase superfamily)
VKPRSLWRRAGLAVLVLVLGLVLVGVAAGYRAFGKGAQGERRARMEKSPQFRAGQFVNPQPITNDIWGMVPAMFSTSDDASPRRHALPARKLDPKSLRSPPASGLRITWLGHSSMLVEIDGQRVLTDPMWSERSSPVSFVGPVRWFAPPIALADLPHIDAVLISHDHYDHLDYRTISAMKGWDTRFVVPLGVGAHLAYWGVPEARIVELDWWQRVRVAELEVVCTPARHASGRTLFDKDATLWAGYALLGKQHRVFYSGDTGLFPAMRDIGERLGPFDVTMIETGQYHGTWPDWHIGPEQAVTAHRMLRGRIMLPVHWGLVQLAFHGWTEPIERVLVAAERAQVKVVAPRPGQSVEPERPPPFERWWPKLPWQTARQAPVVSSLVPASSLPTP